MIFLLILSLLCNAAFIFYFIFYKKDEEKLNKYTIKFEKEKRYLDLRLMISPYICIKDNVMIKYLYEICEKCKIDTNNVSYYSKWSDEMYFEIYCSCLQLSDFKKEVLNYDNFYIVRIDKGWKSKKYKGYL